MKAIQLILDTPNISLKKVFENFDHFDLRNRLSFNPSEEISNLKQKLDHALGGQLTAKSASTYLFDAAIEGLKQNFLGPHVNMEFFVLTARVYVISLTRLAASASALISPKFILS